MAAHPEAIHRRRSAKREPSGLPTIDSLSVQLAKSESVSRDLHRPPGSSIICLWHAPLPLVENPAVVAAGLGIREHLATTRQSHTQNEEPESKFRFGDLSFGPAESSHARNAMHGGSQAQSHCANAAHASLMHLQGVLATSRALHVR